VVKDKNNISDSNVKELTIELAHQKRLINNILRLYESDRKEWERLLHDQFGQSLAAIKSFSVGIQSSTDLTEIKDISDIIISAADELYISSYDMMRSLRSGFMQDSELTDAIKVCIDNSRLSQSGVKVEFDHSGDLSSLGDLLNVAILRIIQEILVNLSRFANPVKSNIHLSCHKEQPESSQIKDSNHINISFSCVLTNSTVTDEFLPKFEAIKRYVLSLSGRYDMVIDKENIEIKVIIDTDDLILG